jgi:hypothetical protein
VPENNLCVALALSGDYRPECAPEIEVWAREYWIALQQQRFLEKD